MLPPAFAADLFSVMPVASTLSAICRVDNSAKAVKINSALFDVMLAQVIGELVARFLPCHALLNPLVTAAMLLPGLAGAVERQGWVGHFLHTLIAHLGQPELDRLSFGTGDGLDDAQQAFCIGHIGEPLFAVCCW